MSFTELRERKIVQWGVAYLAGGWVALQVLAYMTDTFGWPVTVRQTLTILIGVGFLAVLVLAWYHGEQGRQRVSGVELSMLAALLVIAGTAIAFVRDDGPARTEATASASEPDAVEASIAVLPFENMSPDPDNEYFADGLAEEILNALAKVPGLEVAARTSSFSFKEKNADIRTIAGALGVRTVLEGSVRKSGTRVRITAQLIDAGDGHHLWSETYDRELDDIFAVQEEIARAIVGALEVRLAPDATALVEAPTGSREAYEEYLRGRFLWSQRTEAALLSAVERFTRAVELDPEFALAWAGLADAHLTLQWYLTDGDVHAHLESGRAAAVRAIELDPGLGQAHVAMGLHHASRFEWDEADRAFRRGLELDPRYPTGRYWYGLELAHQGRFEEGWEQARIGAELDPLSLINVRGYGMLLMWGGRLEEAIAQFDRVVELNPTFFPVWESYARVYAILGRWDEAETAYVRAAEYRGLDPDEARQAIRAVRAFRTTGRRVPVGAMDDWPADDRAGVRAMAGWEEEALEIVRDRLEAGDPDLREWGVQPWLAPLHDDPRFAAMLREIGVAPAPEARVWLTDSGG